MNLLLFYVFFIQFYSIALGFHRSSSFSFSSTSSFLSRFDLSFQLFSVTNNPIPSQTSLPFPNEEKSSSSPSIQSIEHIQNRNDLPQPLQRMQHFLCLSSSSVDLFTAIQEILQSAKEHYLLTIKPDLAFLFVSSMYENKEIDYQEMLKQISVAFPSLQSIIGSTTSCPIGLNLEKTNTIEIEGRHGMSIYFLSFQNYEGTTFQAIQYSENELVEEIARSKSTTNHITMSESDETNVTGKLTIFFASNSIKSLILDYVYQLQQKDTKQTIIGSFASAVNELQKSRLFLYTPKTFEGKSEPQKLYDGLVGITIKGNFHVDYHVARSIKPVGPLFRVKEAERNEILKIEDVETLNVTPPIDALSQVLNILSSEDSYSLKKQLLVAISPEKVELVEGKTLQERPYSSIRCDVLDPVGGSVTIPYRRRQLDLETVPSKHLLQFCKWDKLQARLDLEKISRRIKLEHLAKPENNQALLLFSNTDRGVAAFRLQHYEPSVLSQAMKKTVSIGGMAGDGVFVFDQNQPEDYGILSTDAVYVLIKNEKQDSVELVATAEESEKNPNLLISPADVINEDNKLLFDDEFTEINLQKRDPLTSHSVKVGTLDFSVPDKIPKPNSFFESLVWDRDKVTDRLREQYPNLRALQMAKLSIAKYPKVPKLNELIHQRLKQQQQSNEKYPLIALTLMRASVNNGYYPRDLTNPIESDLLFKQLIKESQQLTLPHVSNDPDSLLLNNLLVSVGCQVETDSFKGQYEDLDVLKREMYQLPSNLPVICDDFILYAYQIFRSKAHAADAVRIYAPALPLADLSYMVKTARSIQLESIVIVSSKQQLLTVLEKIPEIQALSVTSRNFKIWKIDTGKATRILKDPDVQAAILKKRQLNPAFVLFQEGFTESKEITEAKQNGVDAIFLGEELLSTSELSLQARLNLWLQ